MKLFLASSLNQTIQKFDEKIEGGLRGKTVLFFANASDPYDGEKWWITNDRIAFEKFGCIVHEADLRTLDSDALRKLLDSSDIIHFCGGSVVYLMSLIRERGVEEIIKEYVLSDKIMYSGTSAGSMIASKNLELCKYDTEEEPFVSNMKDWSGFAFVHVYILPHAGSPDFSETNKEIVGHVPKHPQAVIVLFDHQAVWYAEEKFEIVQV
ncbi:MAG: type 1 glutamine amidotransferase-like domain-containing protein [Candidatus Yonathbacteria bacterium]|nr:type 1 glutamine amidotransferase-like domain-containing protein [Candidatus Yonathbacteria bacterium]NTW47426.1 type 1 glutamine amidotransferase-like domain-containing protein [Candidatus Yonathbacteria bacterium]